MTILVTGATGLIGSAVVEALVGAGERTAVVTRTPADAAFDPRVEIRQGDISRPDGLGAALDDVDRMFLFPMAAPAIVGAARAAGVDHVVLLSSMNAAVEGMPDPLHKPMERALEASGMSWTHLRPGEFAHNKTRLWGEDIRRARTVHWPDRPGQASAPVHERDIADVATTALRDPDRHRGRSYVLTGPEALSVRDQVHAISDALGEPIDFRPVELDEALDGLRARGGWGAAAGRAVLHLDGPDTTGTSPTDVRNGDEWIADPRHAWMLAPSPDVTTATRQPGRSFGQWARDHVDDFR